MELIDGACWHLNLAISRTAIPQRLDVRTLEREVLQVGQLRRTAEFADGEVARKFPKPSEVSRKLQIIVRCDINVDRAKNENLIRRAGMQSFGNSLAAADGCNLIVTESDVVLEIGL